MLFASFSLIETGVSIVCIMLVQGSIYFLESRKRCFSCLIFVFSQLRNFCTIPYTLYFELYLQYCMTYVHLTDAISAKKKKSYFTLFIDINKITAALHLLPNIICQGFNKKKHTCQYEPYLFCRCFCASIQRLV